MSTLLTKVATKNYRALADVEVNLGPINVFFGPNGAGKSTFLDTVWFVRDCAVRGVDEASSARDHGIGILWDGASENDKLEVAIETEKVRYELRLGFSSGRIEPFPGETLRSLGAAGEVYIGRSPGRDKADFRHLRMSESVVATLREPQKLSLSRYLDFEPGAGDVAELDRRLRFVRLFSSRSFALREIRKRGSERGLETFLWSNGQNLWSVLENIHGRRALDDRYDTILDFMRKAFPTFRDLILEPTGPSSVYGSFLEEGRKRPVLASGISDGHIHLLLLLTSLFSEGRERTTILLFDEPEISLHPWALAVLADAIKTATKTWSKQTLIATHSPVLMSQFEAADCFTTELLDGRAMIRRVSERPEIADLLGDYALGSIFMAESIAPQSTMNKASST